MPLFLCHRIWKRMSDNIYLLYDFIANRNAVYSFSLSKVMTRSFLVFSLMVMARTLCLGQEPNPFILRALDKTELYVGSNENFHSALRYDIRGAALDQLFKGNELKVNQVNAVYLQNEYRDQLWLEDDKAPKDSTSGGFWSSFYKTPETFFKVRKDNFSLDIDPVFYFGLGDDSKDDETIFQNTRGLTVEGKLGEKLYFYTQVLETQRRFFNYIERDISQRNAIPGQGFFKEYRSSIFSSLDGWDYLNSQAFINYQISDFVNFTFGHGRNFIGNGYHSLLLNDYAHNYLYLKFNTVFWKVHYQNIFAELSALAGRDLPGNTLLPRKYLAAHYLDVNLTKNFSIGFFESVIFSRDGGFDLQYLNPIMLYRAVEQFSDSPDNVLMGLNAKYNVRRFGQIYGQLLIDELRVSEAFSGNGWWGNKVGYQIGVKVLDLLGVSNLDWLTEFNTARPFTYAHRPSVENNDIIASYSHYNQPLAHPLGSNFREWVNVISYQPSAKWHIQAKVFLATKGEDNADENNGGDLLKDYSSRVSDFGNFTTQGLERRVSSTAIYITWMPMHNFYVGVEYLYRRDNTEDERVDLNNNYFGLSFRVNTFTQKLDY